MTTPDFTGKVGRLRPQDVDDEPREWRFVPFDISVPSDYWREGQEAIPGTTRQRIERLDDYEDLFHGELSRWLTLEERLVVKNWFGNTAMVYVDFMMSSRPEWFVGEQPLLGSGLLPDASLRSFNKATELIIRDQVTYGVGLAEVEQGRVRRIAPRTWFPTGGDDDVAAGPLPGDSGAFMVKRYEPGGIVLREYLGLDENNVLREYAGEQLPSAEMIGQEAAWEVIEELTDGRAVTLTACPREPAEGEWGWRLFEDMAKLGFEYVRRESTRSASITRHEDPLLAALPEVGGEVDVRGRPQADVAMPEREQVRVDQLQTNLARWRSQHVAMLPVGIGSMEYISFDGRYEASADALDDMRKDIISEARLPASLLGIDDIKLGSGVALRVSHSQTYLTLQQMQESLVEHLRRIMLILALEQGASAEMLRAFDAELRVEWMNPVDYLEDGVDMTTEEGGELEAEDDADVLARALAQREAMNDGEE